MNLKSVMWSVRRPDTRDYLFSDPMPMKFKYRQNEAMGTESRWVDAWVGVESDPQRTPHFMKQVQNKDSGTRTPNSAPSLIMYQKCDLGHDTELL